MYGGNRYYPVSFSFGFITFIAAKCIATSVAKLCQDFPPKSGPIFSKASITLGAIQGDSVAFVFEPACYNMAFQTIIFFPVVNSQQREPGLSSANYFRHTAPGAASCQCVLPSQYGPFAFSVRTSGIFVDDMCPTGRPLISLL